MPQGSNLNWTDDIIGRLKALWAEGHSTAEIGRRIGVSKNAVVGKAHRLHLPPRPSPIRSGSAGTPKLPRQERQPVRPLEDIAATSSVCLPLHRKPAPASPPTPEALPTRSIPATLPRPAVGNKACCWPIGEPGRPGFRFCEDPALVGRSYCEAHCGDAYRRHRSHPEARQL